MARSQLTHGDPEEFVGIECVWCGWFTTISGWLRIERCRRTDGKNDCFCSGVLEDMTRARHQELLVTKTRDRLEVGEVALMALNEKVAA